MKIKNVKLEWYAFKYDSNSKKLKFINVLSGMEKEIEKKIEKGKKDNWKPVTSYSTFKDWLKGKFMYYYWNKTEHEVIIGNLFENDTENYKKYDIWWQLEPNLDRICEYIIREMDIIF